MSDKALMDGQSAWRAQRRHLHALVVAAGLLLACLTLSRAGAQLRFHGESAHTVLWRRIYSQLPAPWRAHKLVYVREISDEEMDRLVERFEGPHDKDDSVVDGCFQGTADSEDTAGRITLRASLHGENAAMVFVHEYGHYVWSNVLTGPDRTRYRRLWREQKRIGSLITEYAGDSDEEGFAEAFAYFIRRPGALKRVDARSSRFLAEIQESDDEAAVLDRDP